LNKKTFDFFDINILLLISSIQIKYKELSPINKLIDILENQNHIITSSETSQILSSIYADTCLFLTRLHDYSKAVEITSKGIEFSHLYNDISSLAHLYYSKSHSLSKLGKKRESEIEAVRCILSAIAKDNLKEINVFFKEIEFDHKINPIDLIKRHQASINIKNAG